MDINLNAVVVEETLMQTIAELEKEKKAFLDSIEVNDYISIEYEFKDNLGVVQEILDGDKDLYDILDEHLPWYYDEIYSSKQYFLDQIKEDYADEILYHGIIDDEILDRILIHIKFERCCLQVPVYVSFVGEGNDIELMHVCYSDGHVNRSNYLLELCKLLQLSKIQLRNEYFKWFSFDLADIDDQWLQPETEQKQPLVGYRSLIQEIYGIYEYADFVFLGILDLGNFATVEKPKKITIQKGNRCGFFASGVGGGSELGVFLKNDLVLDYSEWEIIAKRGYTIDDVYGVLDSFFGDELVVK